MSEQEINAVVELTKEVVKETYSDVAHPVLKPTGETLGLIPRAIKAAFLPLEKWIVGREYSLAETKKLLEEKLYNVPPNQINPPEAYIGVPALQYISYCMDSEELRNMYAELLAKSMNEATRGGVHPSFVEIIKQLCPDEAKILRFIDNTIPVITVRRENSQGSGTDLIRNFSDVGYRAECEYPSYISQYIENMERLGLISDNPLSSLTDKSIYEPIKNHPEILKKEKNILSNSDEGMVVKKIEGFFYLNDFGHSFKDICITPINEVTIYVR
jgi:hypothetical protein